MQPIAIACFLAAVLGAGRASIAQPPIEPPYVDVTQYTASGVTENFHVASGNDINIHIKANVTRIEVKTYPGSSSGVTDIGRIYVTNASGVTSPNAIRLYVAQSVIADPELYTVNAAGDYAGNNWAGIEDNRPDDEDESGPLHLKAYIRGNLTGAIVGAVVSGTPSSAYSSLHSLELGLPSQTTAGAVQSKVWAADGFFRVVCREAISGNAECRAEKSIKLIRATDGDLTIPIIANNSGGGGSTGYSIDLIDVWAGDLGGTIGTDDDHVVSIGRISVVGSVTSGAHIVAPAGVAWVETLSGPGGVNPFAGQLQAPLVDRDASNGGLIDITGDLTGTLSLDNGLREGDIVRIGGKLGDSTIPSSSIGLKVAPEYSELLAGQVIINAGGSGSATWWSRLVQIGDGLFLGPTQSNAPFYAPTSADLGGGAIGVVPFRRHKADCSPSDYSETQQILQSQLNHFVRPDSTAVPQVPIDYVFYGPVKKGTTAGVPVRVFHRITDHDPNNSNHPLDVDVTNLFTVTVNPSAVTGSRRARTVRIEGKANTFYYPGLYRIQPVLTGDDRLYCDVPGTSPPSVYGSVNSDGVDAEGYWFTVLWDCNGNEVDDATDLEFDTNHVLDADPADGIIDDCNRYGFCLADFDGNGYVNGVDFDLFVYFYQNAIGLWADINGNGFVEGGDFEAFSNVFEDGC